jgi:hypothetical protein
MKDRKWARWFKFASLGFTIFGVYLMTTLPKHNLAHFAIDIFYETSSLAWFPYRHFVKEFYVQSNIQAMRVAMAMPRPLTSRKKKLLLFHIAILQFLPIKTGTRVFSTQGKTDKNIPDEIRTLCKQGRLKEALHALYTMNNPLDSATYDSILQLTPGTSLQKRH